MAVHAFFSGDVTGLIIRQHLLGFFPSQRRGLKLHTSFHATQLGPSQIVFS